MFLISQLTDDFAAGVVQNNILALGLPKRSTPAEIHSPLLQIKIAVVFVRVDARVVIQVGGDEIDALVAPTDRRLSRLEKVMYMAMAHPL